MILEPEKDCFSGAVFHGFLEQARMKKKRKKIIVVICVLLAAVLAAACFVFLQKQEGKSEADEVLTQMEAIIPGLGQEDVYSSGMGRDPLAVLEIRGVDIVGCVEIPSLNLRAPVADKDVHKKYFARWASGSPVKGKLRIMGGRHDVFSRIAKGKPGETVRFTDTDGVRYEYTITTQFHLKDWAKADYDLMLCYKVDDDTKFVLGCTRK